MPSITVRKPADRINILVALPRSKSVAARAAIIASMAVPLGPRKMDEDEPFELKDFPTGDDSATLKRLLDERPHVMHCGMGGTTFRFLLAWAAIRDGEEHILTGDARLLERPHQALVDALRQLGADIEQVPEGYRVRGRKLAGGEVTMDTPASSQFISALMMIGPMMENGILIHWHGPRLSEPYIMMTMIIMKQFNADSSMGFQPHRHVAAENGGYSFPEEPFSIPTDWSAASFIYQIIATAPGARATLNHLDQDSFQGDEAIRYLLKDEVETADWVDDGIGPDTLYTTLVHRTMRPVREGQYTFDLMYTPDIFPMLAITQAMLGRSARFTGLDSLPLKESDRIAGISDALDQLGIPCTSGPGWFELASTTELIAALADRSFTFNPRGDHRMAMALAPLSLVCEQVTIEDPGVVTKSYPGFWEDIGKAGFRLERKE